MIRLENAAVTYPGGVEALRPTTLTFQAGEFAVLLGPSGAGKSTLLRSLNGLVGLQRGKAISKAEGDIADVRALRRHRRRTGMIFQHHQLIGRLSVLSNVLTGRLGYHPLWRSLAPSPRADKLLALDCLRRVGLAERALQRVDLLSGGERQRVGVARALCQQPDLILADEPVASLDPATAASVLAQLKSICACDGITAVVSLHQVDLAHRFADRIIGIARGAVVAETAVDGLTPQLVEQIYGASDETARAPAFTDSPYPSPRNRAVPQPGFATET